MLLGVLCNVLVLIDCLGNSVDFRCSPTSVGNLLPLLSERVGIDLLATPETRWDVMVIRVRGVPVDRLLSTIGRVSSAKWERRKDGLYLVRDDEAVSTDVEAERNVAEGEWKSALELVRHESSNIDWVRKDNTNRFLDQVSSHNEWARVVLSAGAENAVGKARSALIARLPLRRLAFAVVESLSPQLLASLHIGNTVYSSNPTAMQERLPREVSKSLGELQADQNRLMSEIEGNPRSIAFGQEEGGIRLADLGAKVASARSIVVLSKMEGMLHVRVLLVQGQHIVAREELTFGVPAARGQASPNSSSLGSLRSPSEVEDLRRALSEAGSIESSGALHDELIHPEKTDPLKFGPMSLVASYAEAADKNLVAVLPDYFDPAFRSLAVNPVQRNSVFAADWEQLMRGALNWQEEDGWILLRPRRANKERVEHLDRPALGTYLRRLSDEGWASLEDMSAYLGAQPVAEIDPFYVSDVGSLLQGWRTEGSVVQPAILRFYGVLSVKQKQATWTESGLRIASLLPAQRQLLDLLLFWSDQKLSGRVPPELEEFNHEELITETLPFGLPADTVFRGQMRRRLALLALRKRQDGGAPGKEVTELSKLARGAARLTGTEVEVRDGQEASMQEYVGFAPIIICDGHFEVDVGQSKVMRFPFQYPEVPKGVTFVRFRDLPSTVQEAYREEVRRLGGAPQRTQPPPRQSRSAAGAPRNVSDSESIRRDGALTLRGAKR